MGKKDDVRNFVVRRELNAKKKKAPKIQRLVTPAMLQRKRFFRSQTRQRMVLGKKLGQEYAKRVVEYRQEQKELRAAEVAKKKKEKKAKAEVRRASESKVIEGARRKANASRGAFQSA